MSLGRQGGQKKAARRKFARNARIAREAKLYGKEKTQAEIAEIVGVDQKTVSRDLNALDQRRMAAAVDDIRFTRERQLRRLYLQLSEVDARLKLVSEQVKTTRQEMQFAPGEAEGKPAAETVAGRKVIVTSAERGGFEALHALKLSIESEIAKIEGNYAPSKRALTDPDGNPLAGDPGEGLFSEDVIVIRRRTFGGSKRLPTATRLDDPEE